MFSSIYNFIEKNPFKKFLILLAIGTPLIIIDPGFGLLLIIISFIYGIFLVKGKQKFLAIGIILNISTGLLFYNELSKGISSAEVLEKTLLFWIISILYLLFGLFVVYKK